jgi:hypothetical protein
MWAYLLVWPGNYLLKHSLSKKEPNELKLTVHTSGESLIEMNPGHVCEGQNLGEYRVAQKKVLIFDSV